MSTYEDIAYEPWGYDDDPDTELLTMAEIRQIADDHHERAAELIRSHIAVQTDRIKEWAGTIETALWGMKHLAVERNEWMAVIELIGSKGYWVVNTDTMAALDPDIVQILAEKDAG